METSLLITPEGFLKASFEDHAVRLFYHGELIGELKVEDGQFHFSGKAEGSARQFFEQFLRPVVDSYLESRLNLNINTDHIAVCDQCGCPDIEMLAWIKVNTMEFVNISHERKTWCPECEELVNPVYRTHPLGGGDDESNQ